MAVKLTPDGHMEMATMLNSLGASYQIRFSQLEDVKDLETAIDYQQKTVDLTPDEHPRRPARLGDLAEALDIRFEHLKRVEDIEMSLNHRRLALQLTPEGDSGKPRPLWTLGFTLFRRYQCLNDNKDFDEAITNYRMALDPLPEAHPAKVEVLRCLGLALKYRYDSIQKEEDLKEAHKCSSTVANFESAAPYSRLWEARQCARLSEELGLSPLPAYQIAIDMLPRVAWLGIPIHGQHSRLEEVGDTVRDAVGAAMKIGEYDRAVEWVEAGRSIAWQNLLRLRTPMDELRLVYPELATRLQSISQQLDIIGHAHDHASDQSHGELKDMGTAGRSMVQLGLDWDKAVEGVRTKPGFESFLKARSFNQLTAVTRDGPVIILNVQQNGCAALLLIPEESGSVHATCIPLSDFSLQDSVDLYSALVEMLFTANVRDRGKPVHETRKGYRVEDDSSKSVDLKDILETLWRKIVKPVIDALAYQPRIADLPHIWWCATGPLAFLPVHAAGIYEAEHTEPGHKLSDYVASPYTPILSALLDHSIPASKEVSILAVAQTNAPGASPIPKTEDEVKRIKKLAVSVPFASLKKKDATIEKCWKG